jgi:hypothetical protein
MEHYKNLSLENIVEEIDGVIYTEEWMPIKSYECYYAASTMGRIKRLKRDVCNNQFKEERILRQKIGGRGYLDVHFSVNGIVKTFRVARIIANTFIVNPENKPQVNHKKGNKLDNRVYMLEWNTGSENQKHSFRELNRKPTAYWTGKESPRRRKVMCIETNKIFQSVSEAAKEIGVSDAMISKLCRKEVASSKKLTFKYLN